MGRRAAPAWIWIAAVSPSLISLILLMPWVFGWEWPRPALVILGVMIGFSPLVDRAIGYTVLLPTGWMRLRIQLSAGLGLVTILMASL